MIRQQPEVLREMGEEPKGLEAWQSDKVILPYCPGKADVCAVQTEAVPKMSALVDRDTVCDRFYMECYMA